MMKQRKFKKNMYELMLVLKQTDEGKIKETVDKVIDKINEDGEVVSVGEWGKRSLAYEIAGETEGVYYLIYFTSNFKAVTKLDRYIRMEPTILCNVIVTKG